MIASDPLWAEVLSGKIDEFSADLYGCQVEKVPDAFHLHRVDRPMQPNHTVLENIISLLPAAEAGVLVEHPPRKPQQAVAGVMEQLLLGM